MLCKHFAAPLDMLVVDQGLVAVFVVDFDKVACEGRACDQAIGTAESFELGFFSYHASELVSVGEGNVDILAGEIIAFELFKDKRHKLVNARDCGELDFAEDGVAKSIGEDLLNVAGATILQDD